MRDIVATALIVMFAYAGIDSYADGNLLAAGVFALGLCAVVYELLRESLS